VHSVNTLVLVKGVTPHSNADTCGGFKLGDALIGVRTKAYNSYNYNSCKPSIRLEGKNLATTCAALRQFRDDPEVVLIVKRLEYRGKQEK
jgi:hypothetical protein